MEGINQFRLYYIYTWKSHNEIPYIGIISKQKCLFSKMKDRKVKQILSGGLVPVRGGRLQGNGAGG
jgi:hypothetical protein